MIASEAVPFAKTGGLADVAGALPVALSHLGHRITLVTPRYRMVEDWGVAIERLVIELGGRPYETGFYEQRLGEHARAVLVDCPELYDRDELYTVGGQDFPDNARRFAFLARAALEFAVRSGERPSVVHAHEWQSGLAPVYLKTRYAGHPDLGGVPSVFTIHNLAYQGVFSAAWLPNLDLDPELFTPAALEYWGQVSFLKGGINFSEVITTVSKGYAKEIQTPEYGFGFDGIVRGRSADLVGILNGIDSERWDPERDRFLPEPYGPSNLSGKRAAKREALAAFGLSPTSGLLKRPLVGMVSRLADQKGFDLLASVVEELPRLEATFVLLGTGESRYEGLWRAQAARHPDRVGVHIGFDERRAHLVEGGADIFLMPSRFEPCGLNQMYSLRYGTVPVVRATGGLGETVKNYNPRTKTGTGFTFVEYAGGAVIEALQRALRLFEKADEWRALQIAGMKQDHSWEASAREYVKVYDRAIKAARRTTAVLRAD